MRHKSSQSGFTLIEMLVAVTVFVIAVGAIMTIFFTVIRTERKINAMRLLKEDAELNFERMVRDLNLNKIDYANQPNFNPSSNLIYYLTSTNQSLAYSRNVNDSHLYSCTHWPDQCSDLTGSASKIKVDRLNFYISPTTTPYLNHAPGQNQQSHITIVYQTSLSYGSRPEDRAELKLQTTISTRNYER